MFDGLKRKALERKALKVMRKALYSLEPDDFAFSVQTPSDSVWWDVYYKRSPKGKLWTIAFTIRDGRLEIGMFLPGAKSEPEVARGLAEGAGA